MIFSFMLMKLVLLESTLADYSELRPPEIFPDNYDKYEPPWTRGHPAHVYIQLGILDVDKIDEGAMEFSIQSYLGEFWIDNRLNLSVYQHDEHANPVFPTFLIKYLWVPDIVFDNTKNGMLFHLTLPNTNIKVFKDGSFLRTSRYNLIVGCQMNFRYYPMDTQECYIKMALMSNPDYKVLLHWVEELPPGNSKSISLMQDIQPLKYALEEPESYKTTETWASGNYTYLYANFTFVRRITGSVFNVYVPSTLVVLLSWISFWLDVEAVPARVTLGVTSLLTLATQVVQAHTGLPAISYMTAMDVWLFACLITVFSSLIEFAFAYQLFVTSKQNLQNQEIHQKIKVIKAKEDVRILRPRRDEDKYSKKLNQFMNRRNSVASENLVQKLHNEKYLDIICRKMFPFLFVTFSIIYWTYYLYLK